MGRQITEYQEHRSAAMVSLNESNDTQRKYTPLLMTFFGEKIAKDRARTN
jgi:hypothetical protein